MLVVLQTPTSRGKLQSSWGRPTYRCLTSEGEEEEEEEEDVHPSLVLTWFFIQHARQRQSPDVFVVM